MITEFEYGGLIYEGVRLEPALRGRLYRGGAAARRASSTPVGTVGYLRDVLPNVEPSNTRANSQ